MGWKVTFFWKQQAELEGGWSENYWADGIEYGALVTAALALRQLFDQCKGFGVWCPKIRISNPDVFRSGQNTRVPGAAPRAGGAGFSADYPTTKWLIKTASTTQSISQWFGGVQDDSVEFASIVRANAVITRDYARIVTALTANGAPWRIRVLDPAVLPIPILSIDPATGIITVGAHTFATGNRVRVSRINGVTAANGIWKVIQIPNSTTTFQLAGWIPQTTPMTKSPSAFVRLQRYAYQNIAKVTIERATSHKVGRPTDQLGGRRKKKKT